jgi:hypothetical protein
MFCVGATLGFAAAVIRFRLPYQLLYDTHHQLGAGRLMPRARRGVQNTVQIATTVQGGMFRD